MRLFIAEKPSLGRAIAETIGTKKSHKGYIECNNGDIVTWCIGHLLEQAEPEHYDEALKSWSLDTLPIIPKEWVYVAKKETQDQLNVVLELIGKSDIIVNAGDPDREGAYLVNEVLEFANISQEKWDKAERVLINDLNQKAIENALESIEPNSKHLAMSDAAKCRSRADWLIGMNISRICTILGKRQGHPNVFSFGRVQTPTCQLVVKRDLEIANFKPVPFFDVELHCEQDGIAFKAKWQIPDSINEDKRCLDKATAQAVIDSIGTQATVISFDTKRAKSQPPLPFSLKTLQEAMSSQYGYGAKETLDIAQSLYEKHKIVSYPRTDQQYLTTIKRDEIELILANLEGVNNKELAAWATEADTSLVSPCWNDKKLEGKAHTAIIPTTRAPDLEALDDKELNVFHAIACRYLAQFFPVAEDDQTVIELKAGAHNFKTTGTVEVVKGWRVVLGKDKEKEEQSLPALTQDQAIAVLKAELLEKKTTPPKPFTEGTLLTAMCNIAKEVTDPTLKAKLKETAGLGTEATRAGMIETLKERGYLETKGKSIVSTPLGQMLILGLPNKLRDPAMTAIWEQQLDVVENGECSLEKFMSVIEKTVKTYVDDFKSGKLIFKLPESTLPKCPKKDCAGFAIEYDGKKGKAFKCSLCEARFKSDKGKVGKEIKKIKKLETSQ